MNRIKRFDDSRNKKTYLPDINISWSDDFEVWLTEQKSEPLCVLSNPGVMNAQSPMALRFCSIIRIAMGDPVRSKNTPGVLPPSGKAE